MTLWVGVHGWWVADMLFTRPMPSAQKQKRKIVRCFLHDCRVLFPALCYVGMNRTGQPSHMSHTPCALGAYPKEDSPPLPHVNSADNNHKHSVVLHYILQGWSHASYESVRSSYTSCLSLSDTSKHKEEGNHDEPSLACTSQPLSSASGLLKTPSLAAGLQGKPC